MSKRNIILLAFLLLLLIAGIIISGIDSVSGYTIALYWVVAVLFLTVAGNILIYSWLNQRFPWESDILRRMIIQLLVSGVYILLCTNVSYYIFKSYFTEYPPDGQQIVLLNIYGLFILIPAFSIFFGIFFMSKWKKAIFEVEEAKKEMIRSELLALKNHLDPHFLFNNLNILSSLIDTENEMAQEFLEKFAEVYRYILNKKEVETVTLLEELEALDAYIFLINTRFNEQVEFHIDVDKHQYQNKLPTLTLQMLVENALKHNYFSAENKLKIEILSNSNGISITNNYRPKNSERLDSHRGSGLQNIEKRYSLLLKEKPIVSIEKDVFRVHIPLINS